MRFEEVLQNTAVKYLMREKESSLSLEQVEMLFDQYFHVLNVSTDGKKTNIVLRASELYDPQLNLESGNGEVALNFKEGDGIRVHGDAYVEINFKPGIPVNFEINKKKHDFPKGTFISNREQGCFLYKRNPNEEDGRRFQNTIYGLNIHGTNVRSITSRILMPGESSYYEDLIDTIGAPLGDGTLTAFLNDLNLTLEGMIR
jgi:hypothetical protein